MYPAALDVLGERKWHGEELSDWLGIIAGYVASDRGYEAREDWRRKALSDILALRGNWAEALDLLEHALDVGGDDFQTRDWPGLTESLIEAVAAGHGPRVGQLLESPGLVEPMEPLWHAVRAELGENLEPLPSEIMDTVTEIREEFAERSGRVSRNHRLGMEGMNSAY